MTTRSKAATGLTWPEIRARANVFVREWANEASERAEAQTFWNEFFAVFGVNRRRVAVYEQRAERFGKVGKGRIDVFWPGTLLAEHKSAGQDLDAAFEQATDYFAGLHQDELPRYVVVSDFARIRLHDLDENRRLEFKLADLPKRIEEFGFIAGYARVTLREEPEANITAVQRLGELHDALKANRYGLNPDGRAGHPLQVFLVRLLFCLFADDTGLFSPKDSFRDLIETTRTDGSDTGAVLARLFQVLNTEPHARQASLAEKFSPFPYVNGRLFEEPLPIPEFDADMRRLLLACCDLQWANISPAIFGAMFQKIIELDAKDRRRQLGAHYTSEANILKLIGPLFLDELRAQFQTVRHHKEKLFQFHKTLSALHFLDPACGCGNFLVITYRELRKLELDVLQAARAFGEADAEQVFGLFQIKLAQFHGIEIEEFPAQVAQVAMWLTQHQMDLLAGQAFGSYFRHLPLADSAHIRHGNALRLDWEDFVPPTRLSYILGNPPFRGKQLQSDEQKSDLALVAGKLKGAGVLDLVTGWYLKAAQYLSGSKEGFASPDKRAFSDVEFSGKQKRASKKREQLEIEDIFVSADRQDQMARENIRCAFVSTNSITQGEQVGVLWSELLKRGIHIQFAHRTFKWTNEAPGKAAVHCVIIGFGRTNNEDKRLFDYIGKEGSAHEYTVSNINPYLANAPTILLEKRSTPLQNFVPEMRFGSMANDGGSLLLTDAEKEDLISRDPIADRWIKPFMQVDELLYSKKRWCLWLVGVNPAEIRKNKLVAQRVEEVKLHRINSKRETTKQLAKFPTLFGEIRQPEQPYLMVPRHTGEDREFIPIARFDSDVICGDANLLIVDPTLYAFGIFESTMHMAWVRTVCGRLESRYRYSAQIVYNNFPWPQAASQAQRDAIEIAAQGVLDARAVHADATLAELYAPKTMPPNLVKAHAALDNAVDAAYRGDGGAKSYAGDADRVAFLFRRYAQLTSVV